MIYADRQNCSITYKTGTVTLRGETMAIHEQANKILRRFASSALHYGIVQDSKHKVVLKACH